MRNRGFEFSETIQKTRTGETLLDYLERRYQHSSREQWQQRIDAGQVRLDASPVEGDASVRGGQQLTWQRPPWDEPDAPRHFDLIHADDVLVAVNKPAGLPTLPGAGFLENTLLSVVRERFPTASPLHRLGRHTSGVVLCSLDRDAHAELTRQWQQRSVSKLYRALATGVPARDSFEITTPIGPVPHPLLGTVHAASGTGKPASSHVRVLRRDDDRFLCEVSITTGRPHQIRIHLAAAGHPLLGDPLYPVGGIPAEDSATVPGAGGYLLHAMQLGVDHPITGQRLTVTAPPPAQLR